MSEREDAKKHIRTMIMTALANSHEEAQADSTRTWQVITDAILDQITLPQSGWALKELSKPAPYQDAAPKEIRTMQEKNKEQSHTKREHQKARAIGGRARGIPGSASIICGVQASSGG
jgi:hypothetical protein